MIKNSIFEYKYSPTNIKLMEFLKDIGIEYIEVPPIIPIHSEMYLPLKKKFNTKGIYTLASFDLNFNIINQLLIKRKIDNCFTVLKGIYKEVECTFVYIQSLNMEDKIKTEICEFLTKNKYKYKVKIENKTVKFVVLIKEV